jgi:hypothetical protein
MNDEPTPSLGQRLAWHSRNALRASRFGTVAALVGGGLAAVVLPVRGAWLAALVAGGCVVGALLCVVIAGHRPLPDASLEIGPALEKVGAADQVGHGLARAGLVLAAFALGAWLGSFAH